MFLLNTVTQLFKQFVKNREHTKRTKMCEINILILIWYKPIFTLFYTFKYN